MSNETGEAMLKRNNNADLIKLEIDEMYHLLYQTWKELTDRRTIGSYQYKIMNSISALRELYDVIGLTLDGTYSTNHSVAECQGETLRILRKDRVLADGHRATYNQLLSRLGRKSKDEAELHALQYHIKYCYDAFSPTYLEEHFSALEKAVSQSEQDKIMQNTEIIISYCASLAGRHQRSTKPSTYSEVLAQTVKPGSRCEKTSPLPHPSLSPYSYPLT
mgnify:CR=1 FL=1